MDSPEARLKLLERKISQQIPRFRVGWKDTTLWQRIIGALVFFNRSYMIDYVSTFYPVVYWPTEDAYKSNPWESFKILSHEYVHLDDARKQRLWFPFSYIMPHWLVLCASLAVFAIWFSNWWLIALAALLFGCPIPAVWRMNWELRGYTMSMAIDAWKYGSIQPSTVDWISKQFTGPDYYFMWPFREGIRRKLEQAQVDIHNGNVVMYGVPFKHVKEIMDMSDDAVVNAARGLK